VIDRPNGWVEPTVRGWIRRRLNGDAVTRVRAISNSGDVAADSTFRHRRSYTNGGLRPVLEVGFLVLPALIAPLLVFKYLTGSYHEQPFVMAGKYYPDGGFLFDLHVMWSAGHDVVTGHSPYPFVYPAPAAILMVPFGALPWKVAVVAFSLTVMAAAVLTLRVLGIRDWRCYAAALGSLPGVTAVTAGTLSWPLALCAALAWRYRDRRFVVAGAIALAVVTKLFLWPLVIWLIATRRMRTAATTIALAITVVIASWAVIGFAGMLSYPHHLGTIQGFEQEKGYSLFPLLRGLGLSTGWTRVVLLALTVVLIGVIVKAGRGRDGERRAFCLAVGAALLLSPIMWPHYLVLLFVILALFRRAFCAAWAVPLLYWVLPYLVVPGSHSHVWSILIAALITLVMWSSTLARRDGRGVFGLASP
jgi:alpha-1,2-mannosyltransferase